MEQVMYQVSTLQALAMGYSRAVVSVDEFLKNGDIGLGTFENVDGEMIMVDGKCYRAQEDGTVVQAEGNMGVPFAVTTFFAEGKDISVEDIEDIDKLKQILDVKIEEDFGLNSMHMVRIDGSFSKVCARSESAYRSHHVSLKDILKETQKDFFFDDIKDAPGWHLHFVSEDRTQGGHVFDLKMNQGEGTINKISRIQIELPTTPAFDTYSLKEASQDEIEEVEQGKG